MPRDGWEALSFDTATNRITTSGFQYDAAGNQTQVARIGGGSQRYQYDAANRLVKVYDGNNTLLQTTIYGATNQRLMVQDGDANSNNRTYYAAAGGAVLAEYVETSSNPTTPTWSKTYLYLGARLLATFTPNGGGEYTQYHHPDRLGTRLLTNASDTTAQEQATLPYGTALDAESTGATNRRFTSYDRSGQTGLDYAVNRTYDAQQGRFTQVDPIGMQAASLADPQSLNLYNYCGNDPINHTDPAGLFWGKLFRLIGTVFKIVAVVVAVALAVIAIWLAPALGAAVVAKLLVMSGLILANQFAPRPVRVIIGLALIAYGIYNGGGVNVIKNFTEAIREGKRLKALLIAAPWLASIGSISAYKRDKKKKTKEEKVRDTVRAISFALLTQNFRDNASIIRNNKQGNQSTELALCHAGIESSFDPNAIGKKGEVGLFQLKESTAGEVVGRDVTRAELLDPAFNTRVATQRLQSLIDRFGDVRTALGAYKQGVSGVINKGLSEASQVYADSVLKCVEELNKM
jgi:RHS repeat-associated protein